MSVRQRFLAMLAATSGGSIIVNQTEIDFGSTPVRSAIFTITDAAVSTSSNIVGAPAYLAPTGKSLDAMTCDMLYVICGNGAGSFSMFVQTMDGSFVSGKFKINYVVG